MSKPYAVRYTEWSRNGTKTTKEKDFSTAAERERFIDKVSERDGFGEVLAFSDPPKNVPEGDAAQ